MLLLKFRRQLDPVILSENLSVIDRRCGKKLAESLLLDQLVDIGHVAKIGISILLLPVQLNIEGYQARCPGGHVYVKLDTLKYSQLR